MLTQPKIICKTNFQMLIYYIHSLKNNKKKLYFAALFQILSDKKFFSNDETKRLS
jgi:hypothetical protein